MAPEDLYEITLQIKRKLKFKKKLFLFLFSWSGGPRKFENIEKINRTNINIQNFINISDEILPSKIVFLSSAGALYPEGIKSYKFPETYTPSPKSFYGIQKFMSKKPLLKHFKSNSQILLILRISSAFGFDKRFSDHIINKWLYSAANNKSLKLYNSKESQVNFISFDQISKAIFISIVKELNGIYNIGSENSISARSNNSRN